MTAFYKRLLYLCELKGITPHDLVKGCGLSSSMPTYWKTRDTVPNSATMQKLADALDVPVSHQPHQTNRKTEEIKILGFSFIFKGFRTFWFCILRLFFASKNAFLAKKCHTNATWLSHDKGHPLFEDAPVITSGRVLR